MRVVGDFNLWDGRLNPMRSLGSSGIWELFVPGVGPGARYKYEVLTGEGHLTLKADAVAAHQWADEPPATDSVVAVAAHQWADDAWLARRDATDWLHPSVSAYEVHLGSWLRRAEDGGRPLTYRELAEELPDYVAGLGFTHVSLMPVAEHPFSGSWLPGVLLLRPHGALGLARRLQGSGRRPAPARPRRAGRLGAGPLPPRRLGLARFDGTALYERQDPRQGEQPRLGHPGVQLSGATRCATSWSPTPCTG